jgi:hypothetical protein
MPRNLKTIILWSLVGVNVLIVFAALGGGNGIINGFDGKSLLQNLLLAVRFLIILSGSFVISGGISIIAGAIALLLFRSRQVAARAIKWGLLAWGGCALLSIVIFPICLAAVDADVYPSTRTNDLSRFALYILAFAFLYFCIAIVTLIGAIAGMINGYRSHRILQRSRN